MSQLPPSWTVVSLGDLLLELRNGVFVSRPGTENTGRPILRISAVRPMTLRDDDVRYVPSGAVITNEANSRVDEGDLLFTRYSGNSEYVGACARVRHRVPNLLYPDKLIRGRVIHGLVDPTYLEALMSAPQTRAVIRRLVKTTAGQVGISGSDLRSVPVPLAPYCEQLRIIAAIEEQFSRLDAGVPALERARLNLKRMRAAIYEAAVTEWVGQGYRHVRFGDILREPLRNGHSAKADPLGSIPILTLTAVTYGDFGSHNIKMTAADPRRVGGLWLQPDDLLIERSNTRDLVGTACLYRGIPDYAVFPDLVIRARVNNGVIPEYAELVLKAPRTRRYFQQRAQGISGTMPKIDQRAIEDLIFNLPSREKQATIVKEAERQLTLLASLETALELAAKRSSTLRSSVLAAAFSGQLVTQDSSDEPATALLERIATERASSNGQGAKQRRKPRVPREEVTA